VIGAYLVSFPILTGSIWVYRHPSKEILLFFASVTRKK
jgi:hypothetical protein